MRGPVWRKILIGLVMTAIILYLYIKLTNVNVLIIMELPIWVILLTTAFILLADILRAIRLWVITHRVGAPLTLKDSLVVWEASRFFAVLTPGFYGGEVLRVSYIMKKYELSKAIAVNMIELLSESIAISINAIVAFSMLLFRYSKDVNLDVLYLPTLISVGLLMVSTSIPATMRCPKRFGERLYNLCVSVLKAIRVAGYSTLALSVLISTVAIFSMALSFGTLTHVLLHLTFLPILIFICSLPITILPITPGGIGLPETLATLALPSLAGSLASWRILNILAVLSSSLFASIIGGIFNPETWRGGVEPSREAQQ